MAIYASKHNYARNSIFLVMTQLKRFVYVLLLKQVHSALSSIFIHALAF